MDGSRFDCLTKGMAHQGSRRRLLGGVVGVALGLTGLRAVNAATCRSVNSTCREHADCCTGYCAPKNARGRRLCSNVVQVFLPATTGEDGIGLTTGLTLKPGRTYTVTAIDAGANCDVYTMPNGCGNGPNGNPGWYDPDELAPSIQLFALIGRVGSGPWTFIGAGPTVLSGTGPLILAYNDVVSAYWDNIGGFYVTVTIS